ncbi:MAG TPA: CdaR family protein [Candidatus Omnitrophota bacterium]|nr:CdaR family protein [Candidatus Omnitrophota bacterium]
MKFSLGWLTENWGLKLVSLLLAIGFWSYVVAEESIEVTKTVSLEILPPTDKLSVVKSSTSFLEVTFQSPRHMFSALSSANLMARHKIEGAQKAGDYSFNVSPSDFTLPAPEIRIVKIFPSFVTVTLDEVIVKKLPVEVELIGEPAFGYRADREAIEIDPNAVLVEGSKAVLEKMDTIKTEPIQLVGRVRSFRRTARIHQAPEMRIVGDGITEVQIPIKAEFSEREFLDVPVRPLGTPVLNHLAKPEAEKIPLVLKGPRAILDKLAASDVLAYIEVDNLKEGTYQLPVKLVLPPDLSLKDEPPALSVEIRKIK